MYEWIIFLVVLIFGIGLWKRDAVLYALSGSSAIVFGLFSRTKNLFTLPEGLYQSFSIILIFFGFYMILRAGIELFYEEDLKLEMIIRSWVLNIKEKRKGGREKLQT